MREISSQSRFQQTPTVIAEDGNERFIEWQPPRWGLVDDETTYRVTDQDEFRPDSIAYRVYRESSLWWAILHFNGIIDPFSLRAGDVLRIPSPRVVSRILSDMKANRLPTRVIRPDVPPPVPVIRPFTVTPYKRPVTDAEILSGQAESVLTSENLFVYGFKVPTGLSGTVHFQIVASLDVDFDPIIFNKLTLSDQTRWFYYNPNANSGAGAFVAFPSVGINGTTFSGQTVYYNISRTDALVANVPYYFRYRAWLNNVEQAWNISPPVIIPA